MSNSEGDKSSQSPSFFESSLENSMPDVNSIDMDSTPSQQEAIPTETNPLNYYLISGGIALFIAFFLFGNGLPLSLVVSGIFFVMGLAFSYRHPYLSLWIFLIYVPFAGTIAYWIGNDHFTFHLAKDIFYFPALIALIQSLRHQKQPIIIPPQLKLPLKILLSIALLTLILVNGTQQFQAPSGEQPLLMGLFGFKVLVGYIPLITCGYYLVETRRNLYRFSRLQVILTIVCCILGIAQYWLVVQGVCPDNTGLPDYLLLRANLQRKCLVGGALGYYPSENFIRLPGTFVAPWHWAWFLISSTFFSFAAALGDRALPWRITGFVSLGLVVTNSVICGQRTAILGVPLVIVVLMIAVSQVSSLKRVLALGLGIFIFVGGISAIFPNVVSERVESLISRWIASPPNEFVTGQIQWITNVQEGFLGHGLGRATNAVRVLGDTQLIETYYP
ncbi:MAG: hypothetical protein ACFBSC_14370 [Microcoleaceae cyanobacterium]